MSHQETFSTFPSLTDKEKRFLQYILKSKTLDEFDEVEINFKQVDNELGFDKLAIKQFLDSLMNNRYSAQWDNGVMHSSIIWSYILLEN